MPRAPPIVTATIQATTLASLSNILAQLLDCYRKDIPLSLDVAAFLRFLISTILTAPPNFYWQAWLERTFPGRLPADYDRTRSQANMEDGIGMSEGVGGRGNGLLEKHENNGTVESEGDRKLREGKSEGKLNWRNTWTKWFIDCITMGALMNTVAFFLIMGTLKGKPANEILHDIVHDTFPLIFASYKIWPIASIISFSMIPVEKRIVFLSGVGLLWGIYMSLVAAAV